MEPNATNRDIQDIMCNWYTATQDDVHKLKTALMPDDDVDQLLFDVCWRPHSEWTEISVLEKDSRGFLRVCDIHVDCRGRAMYHWY